MATEEDKPLYAVFHVISKEQEALAVIKYIRLKDGISRGAALQVLMRQLANKYVFVRFEFWCESYVADLGAPQVITPDSK